MGPRGKGSSDLVRLDGLYAAVVTDNKDPQGKNQLKVMIPVAPAVGGLWAKPCVPYTGSKKISLPPVKATVWVLFEGGDVTRPVWVGWYPG